MQKKKKRKKEKNLLDIKIDRLLEEISNRDGEKFACFTDAKSNSKLVEICVERDRREE